MASIWPRGLASVIRLTKALCRINALFAPGIRKVLTGNELAAYNALCAACEAFLALQPFIGEDADPETPE